MANLKKIQFGLNKYCGPAVLATITGKSTDECAYVIGQITGKYEIKGVHTKDLIKALDKLRFDVENIPPPSYSLYANLAALSKLDGTYIITVPGHFIAIEVKDRKIFICDNHTKQPMNAAASARLGQRVLEIHKVVEREKPVLIRIEYSLDRSFNWYEFIKKEIYENEKDNITTHKGRISITSKEEFDELIHLLQERVSE